MNYKLIYLWLVCLFFSLNVAAQHNTTIQGTIVDERSEAMPGAVIACFRKSDNQMLHATTSNAEGRFSLSIDWEKELLRISFLGYEDVEITDGDSDPLSIVLKPLSVELGEVVVKARSIVTQKNDRLVFSIANVNITKGNNAMGVLRFTPLMRVENNNLSMIGKDGVTLYVNGKKSNISSNAVSGYLQSLPADKIDKIEVITDPGSSFRTDGNEGIINIVFKKDESQGLKGTLSIGDSQRHYNSYDGNLYLDYQKKKFAFSASVYGENNKSYDRTDAQYSYFSDNRYNGISNRETTSTKNIGTSFTADYQLAEGQTIGAMVDFSYQKRDQDLFTTTLYRPLNSSVSDSTIYSRNLGDHSSLFFSSNLNYRLKTDGKGSTLALDVDYLRSEKRNPSFLDYSYVEQGNVSDPFMRFQQKSIDKYDTYSAKIEYTHVFTPMSKLNFGVEYYHMTSVSDFYYANYQDQNYVNDPQKSNLFDFDEDYVAGFITYNRVWSPKFITVLGARGEYVYDKGVQKITGEKISRHEFAPLPMLVLMYNIHPEHQLSYTFASRMLRIPFNYYNPFRYYVSPTIYKENNPELKTPVAYINSLKYVLKRHYIFSFSYAYSKDGINHFNIPTEEGMTKQTVANFGKVHILNGVFNWNDSFFDGYLYFNLSLDGQYYRSYGNLEDTKIDVSNLSYGGSVDMGVLLSKRYDWNLTGTYRYKSGTKMAQENANKFSNLSVELKKGFSNGISLKAGVNSLFHSKPRRYKEYDNYSYNLLSQDADFRSYYINVSIPFGRKKVSGAKSHSGSSANVKNRIQ